MRLAPGTRLAGYEVTSGLGEGGMGEVYRARDTTLDRDVAIKLVHPSFCHHPDSLDKLRHEARVLAAVNHPHIATLHGLAEFDGGCGLVMELVDGETLAAAIAARRLSPGDSLRFASQIASALEAAHERGIVHRDLKPANIKITESGVVKVLDFGLAKSEDNAPVTAGASTFVPESHSIVGTWNYMSPEQARGLRIDRRTDLWAFGCVLFEMLTGRRAFDGPSPSDVLVSILEREPDWSALPKDTPPPVRRLLRRCLQKDARQRLRDAADARFELEDAAAAEPPSETTAGRVAPAEPGSSWIRAAGILAAGAATGAALVWVLARAPAPATQPPVHFLLALPDGEQLATTDLPALAISPDGRIVSYVASRGGAAQLWIRRLDEVEPIALPGTANALSPFFSPDSQWIGFFADGKLKKVAVAGGPPVTICDADAGFGGTWGSDQTIVFAPTTASPLQRVSANGGVATRVTALDTARGEFSHRWPEFLPDSTTVLFTIGTEGDWDEAEIVAQNLETGQRITLIKGGTHPHYLAGGHLAYTHDAAVWVAPLDVRRLTLIGPPARALGGVSASVDGASQFSVSRTGAISYLPARVESARRLGVVEGSDFTPLAAPVHGYVTPRLSPNGRRLLVGVADRSEHVWSYDMATGSLTQLTFDGANRAPIWTADGQRVTFASNRSGALNLFVAPADGSGAAERLTTSDFLQLPGSWSPDGSVLAFMEQHPDSGRDIWLLGRDGRRAPFANTPSEESAPRFSPDGRWIAYVSDESGQVEVYARPAAGGGTARRISSGGGREPVWRRDGGAMYYRAQDTLITVPVLDRALLRLGPARVLLSSPGEPGSLDAASYDAMGGADRFLMITSAEQKAATALQVILHWPEAPPAR